MKILLSNLSGVIFVSTTLFIVFLYISFLYILKLIHVAVISFG